MLDPFSGTGTTAAVAKRLGRHYIGIEREASYIEPSRQRLAAIEPAKDDAELYGRYATRRNQPRLPFGALLEAGLLQPGTTLYFDKSIEKSATVLADGSLRTPDGTRGSIHKIGVYYSKGPSCNGWDHWYLLDDEGQWLVIDLFREQIRKQRQAELVGENTK